MNERRLARSPQPHLLAERLDQRRRVLQEQVGHFGTQVLPGLCLQLKREGEGFKIQRKLIQLINSTDTLAGIGYIL